jgi:hypothetical protein
VAVQMDERIGHAVRLGGVRGVSTRGWGDHGSGMWANRR